MVWNDLVPRGVAQAQSLNSNFSFLYKKVAKFES